MLELRDFDYDLPRELIAQQPAERRDGARLLVLSRATRDWRHGRFPDIDGQLAPGDLLVLNDTRVVKARVPITKADTGGQGELLFCEVGPAADGSVRAHCLARASKPFRVGAWLQTVHGDPPARVRVAEVLPGGALSVELPAGEAWTAWLDRHGEVPLPPYIERAGGPPGAADETRYQTVYAAHPGAVAAPTAGLHFTPEHLARLTASGVGLAHVTLHVGPGTFLPIRERDLSRHRMHAERYVIPEATAAAIRLTKQRGGRVVAVGTTTVRTLEAAARDDGTVEAGAGETALFIVPGHRFRIVDRLLTNFHLPGSTLILLVAAFAGQALVLDAYRAAVAERYRFYSYGDAMLIL